MIPFSIPAGETRSCFKSWVPFHERECTISKYSFYFIFPSPTSVLPCVRLLGLTTREEPVKNIRENTREHASLLALPASHKKRKNLERINGTPQISLHLVTPQITPTPKPRKANQSLSWVYHAPTIFQALDTLAAITCWSIENGSSPVYPPCNGVFVSTPWQGGMLKIWHIN